MPQAQAAASALTSRKIAAYGALSTAAASVVVLAAFRQRPNFYAAAVLLGRSNGCMLVLLNFGIFLTLVLGKVCQRAFFGPLRDIEIEHLYERSWYAVTESLLAMTIFRDSFDSSFVVLFGTLLFLKVFHWLSADRVEYMEQSPSVNRLFHVRMVSVLWTLLCTDLFLVAFATEVLILDKNRMGIMIMFASEFMILTATLLSTMAKYAINCHDLRSDEPWEAKSMYVFFVDLLTDFLKLVVYVSFFYLILTYYGFPLNMVRDVFFTGRSFAMRIRHFFRYRAATRNMDSRFPDATAHDMRTGSDGTCIICRDEMVVAEAAAPPAADAAQGDAAAARPTPTTGSGLNETPKKLPCGHIFHFHCLRSWLERQQSCPTCRRTVFGPEGPGGAPGAANAAAAGANAPAPPAPGQRPAAPNAAAPTGAAARPPPAPQRGAGIQGFLQQLHADAQRVRETARPAAAAAAPTPAADGAATTPANAAAGPSTPAPTPTPITAPSAAAASSSNAGRSTAPPRTSARPQIHRALIHSMFVNAPAASSTPGRSSAAASASASVPPPATTAQAGSSSTWQFPAPAAQPAPGTPSAAQQWMPPPPWSLRGAMPADPTASVAVQTGTDATATPASTSAESAAADARQEGDAAAAEAEKKEEEQKEEAPADPADAREAARAAALRRFAAVGSGSTPASKARAEAASAAAQASASSSAAAAPAKGSTSRTLPGDPRLIPLFDGALVPPSSTASLPYPLLSRPSTSAAPLSAPDAPLNAGLATLALPTGVSGAAVLASLDEASIASLSERTRGALEEKLRVLGAVQQTVWETVDVLTRALSAMGDGAAPGASAPVGGESSGAASGQEQSAAGGEPAVETVEQQLRAKRERAQAVLESDVFVKARAAREAREQAQLGAAQPGAAEHDSSDAAPSAAPEGKGKGKEAAEGLNAPASSQPDLPDDTQSDGAPGSPSPQFEAHERTFTL